MTTPTPGTIGWHDLAVPNAEAVRDFYAAVVGWTHQPIEMGGYCDFVMLSPGTGDAAGGICHARGKNADLPAQWLMYIIVEDLEAALDRVGEAGGEVLIQPRPAGGGRFAVIRDPAGAVCGLYQA